MLANEGRLKSHADRPRPYPGETRSGGCLQGRLHRELAEQLQEPGIARFDVLQQQDDPTRFVLVEIYRSALAPAAHKQTAHYREWAEAVADMMAVPRSSVKFDKVYPEVELP